MISYVEIVKKASLDLWRVATGDTIDGEEPGLKKKMGKNRRRHMRQGAGAASDAPGCNGRWMTPYYKLAVKTAKLGDPCPVSTYDTPTRRAGIVLVCYLIHY